MMTCERFAQMLDNYENLTDEEKALMSEHASKCEACGRELHFMLSVINSVKTLPEMTVPDDFLKKLNERIDTKERPLRKRGFAPHIRYGWQKYSAVAACLVIAAIIGVNYETLTNRMNGGDDGVISEVTTAVTSPLPGASTAAPKTESAVKAEPFDNGAVIGDAAGRINGSADRTKADEKSADIDTAFSDPVLSAGSISGRVQSRGGFSGGGTSITSSGASRASSAASTSGGTGAQSSSGYASSHNTASRADEADTGDEPARSNQDIQTNQDTQVPADNQSEPDAEDTAPHPTSDTQTITLPRSVYVESRGGDVSEDIEGTGAGKNDSDDSSYSSTYSISGASGADSYAAADTDSGDYEDEDYEDGGYNDASETENDGPGYELNQSNMIIVRGEDFATAFDIICQYASESYSNYFMVTSDNIDAMLGALDAAGVYYHDNIAVDTDKITFRISVG